MRKHNRFTVERLEPRRLLTSLPVVSFTSSASSFSGGFEDTVLGGELTDLNLDSRGVVQQDQLDYAIIREGNVVEFWIHEGNGVHSRAAQEKLAGRPHQLLAADINHDGYHDYLVATDKGIEVFLNLRADLANDRAWNGIERGTSINVVATSMELAHLVGEDGRLDLVITTAEDLEVHPGIGDGTFGPSVSYPIGPGIHSVVVGNRNGQVVVGTQNDRTLEGKAVIFQNDGDDILEPVQIIEDAGAVRTMALADLDSDDQAELIIGTWASRHLSDPGGENIHIWNGNGDGTFAPERVDYETAGSPLDLAIRDLNSDGIEDLIVGYDSTFHHPITNNGPGGVSVLLGAGDGELLAPVRISTPGGSSVSAINWQIAAIKQYGNEIRHFRWNHELSVTGEDFADPVDNLYTRRTVVTGDFNGDGILDVAESESFADQPITIRLLDAEGSPTKFDVNLPLGLSVNYLDTGDLNGDGFDDLAITGRLNFQIRTVGILSNGDGTFSSTASAMNPGDFAPFEIVDIDGDGRDDWLGAQPKRLVYLKSNSAGARETVTLASIPNGDFRDAVISGRNDDGSANLLAISGNGIHSITSDDEGNYTETSVSVSHHFSTFGDFNGDGHMDVALGLYSEPEIRVVLGSDSGELSQPITVANGTAESMTALRRDGADAILLLGSSKVELLSVTADSTPDTPNFESTTVQTGEMMASAYAHDLLGDATPDLIMVQGNGFISSSPSTQILVAEAMPDGTFGQPRHIAVPLVEGQVLATEKTDGQIEIMLSHRWGFATVEIGPGKLGDFNLNGSIDNNDIDLLCAAHQRQDESEIDQFDLDSDGDLDDEDVDVWIREIAQTRRGDVNLDGSVSFADFLSLSGNFGQGNGGVFGAGGWVMGDTSCDGEVTFADFLALSANFGFSRS